MKKILFAEDEAAIREFVIINLERAGYEVIEAVDGEQALELYNKMSDEIFLAVLDVMMPKIDGIEVCRNLRKNNPIMGIIMLTAKTQEIDKVTGLMMGADDYITKPFSPSELLARIDALGRRVDYAIKLNKPASSFDEEFNIGEFSLNLRNRTLSKSGYMIELTQVEFQIMEYFFKSPGRALSRMDILHKVWGENYYGEEKIVDVNIRRLRMKIEKEPSTPRHLVTVWGLGYKWDA